MSLLNIQRGIYSLCFDFIALKKKVWVRNEVKAALRKDVSVIYLNFTYLCSP